MAEKVLKVGMMGEDVAALHQTLSAHGLNVPESETGRGFFGPATRNAVLEIQKRNQLATTGQVDTATVAALARNQTERVAAASVTSATAAGAFELPAIHAVADAVTAIEATRLPGIGAGTLNIPPAGGGVTPYAPV